MKPRRRLYLEDFLCNFLYVVYTFACMITVGNSKTNKYGDGNQDSVAVLNVFPKFDKRI